MRLYVSRVLLLLIVSVSVCKGSGKEPIWPLDMADESVDDAFEGCKDKMLELVEKQYLEKEKKSTEGFSQAWNKALNKVKADDKLNQSQAAAIYVYTMGGPTPIFNTFNNVSRKGKENYKAGSFPYYTLYFFLTGAIQQLKSNGCLNSYRRTKSAFVTDVINNQIRFGSLTSSSLLKNLTHFGKKSCFKIQTCFGAEISKYSALKTHEQEVLIPPYEVFKVTGIIKGVEKNELECEVLYTLKHAGKRSNLNCSKVQTFFYGEQ